ncbi:unnamed protein product [Adineta steineri]|uniref:VCBS repeat-containing protein n=1 Tax=Adineta steineri TaxID=433720 RepID=A0A814Q3P6_9BILA|nr:unnamed protein product [Adineta steineri]CAF1131115.1 unnamed protein product [Adineta steineri]CAF4050278.1 unnamed protein product [Adineta steineri]CAF4119989.1 unnamed protein product [Adineta steineri]
MQFYHLILLVSIFVCPILVKSEIKPVLINKFELAHAGFSTLLRTWTLNSTSWALVISCFNPIPGTTDYVYNVANIEWQLTTKITPTVLTNQIIWPNGIVPADTLIPYSIIVPSGFLVPGKTNGNLYFISQTGSPTPLVPNDKTNWFYHDADFKDMDGDGHFDIVAGRANVPIIGGPTTQLIWLKNPGNYSVTGPWKLNYLLTTGGPDIQVQFAHIDSLTVLFANSYFTRKLQMFWSDSDPLWSNASQLHVRHIDYEPLSYAYIQLTNDLNGDQKPDLLVTVNDEFNGSLIAYELPTSGDIRTGDFIKHVLATGFKPFSQGKGKGAPGQASAVKFYSGPARKKPVIILSGDDDGCVYSLEALHDDDPSNWEYSKKIIHQSKKSTIGQISIEDVDSDGHPEMFVPAYNEGIVYIYRLMDN